MKRYQGTHAAGKQKPIFLPIAAVVLVLCVIGAAVFFIRQNHMKNNSTEEKPSGTKENTVQERPSEAKKDNIPDGKQEGTGTEKTPEEETAKNEPEEDPYVPTRLTLVSSSKPVSLEPELTGDYAIDSAICTLYKPLLYCIGTEYFNENFKDFGQLGGGRWFVLPDNEAADAEGKPFTADKIAALLSGNPGFTEVLLEEDGSISFSFADTDAETVNRLLTTTLLYGEKNSSGFCVPTGDYVVSDFVSGESLLLVHKNGYPRTEDGAWDEILFRFNVAPEDQKAMLLSGDAQIAFDVREQVTENSNVLQLPDTETLCLMVNLNSDVLKERDTLRKVILTAIDNTAICEEIGLIPENSLAAAAFPDHAEYGLAFDLSNMKAYPENYIRPSLTLACEDGYTAAAESVKAQLHEYGIEITVKPYSSSDELATEKYDLVLALSDSNVGAAYAAASLLDRGGERNWLGIGDKDVIDLLSLMKTWYGSNQNNLKLLYSYLERKPMAIGIGSADRVAAVAEGFYVECFRDFLAPESAFDGEPVG